MNLAELKTEVDRACESALECDDTPENIRVSLQINSYEIPKSMIKMDSMYSGDDVELHYDNNCDASGCVLTAFVKDGTK